MCTVGIQCGHLIPGAVHFTSGSILPVTFFHERHSDGNSHQLPYVARCALFQPHLGPTAGVTRLATGSTPEVNTVPRT